MRSGVSVLATGNRVGYGSGSDETKNKPLLN